jgi:hypothetical protein
MNRLQLLAVFVSAELTQSSVELVLKDKSIFIGTLIGHDADSFIECGNNSILTFTSQEDGSKHQIRLGDIHTAQKVGVN